MHRDGYYRQRTIVLGRRPPNMLRRARPWVYADVADAVQRSVGGCVYTCLAAGLVACRRCRERSRPRWMLRGSTALTFTGHDVIALHRPTVSAFVVIAFLCLRLTGPET